jgi:4-amino-4-deoxy-L-arabinose transferase-like glycosyltransferase
MTSSRKAWVITWIFAILPLLGWWLYGLFDIDEGFYGAIVAEMNRRGEWITPYYNGHPWFEKPILLYWFAKPSMMLFGQWIGPRLPSVLATVGTYALVGWFARRRWGEQSARWCVLITASSLFIVGVGRMMMTDAILNLCLVGAFLTFWESLEGDRRWRLLTAFFLGLSVLAKGPVGLPLFVAVAAWTFWRERDLRPAFRGQWLLGIVILSATIATWYVPAYLVNGQDFVQKFLIEQNLNRFTGGDAAHNTPLWSYPIYYPAVLLLTLAPWSFYVLKAWPRDSEPLPRYLATWLLVPLIFFSISKAKLPHYALPCAVPLTLLVGKYLGQKSEDGWKPLRYPLAVCVCAAVLANVGFLLWYNWRLLSGHAQVHALAFYVRDGIQPGQDVAAYQMGRRAHDKGTAKPEIQETSHPSLVMYLDRKVNETDTMESLLSDRNPQWVITRRDRIRDGDIAEARNAGRELTPIATGEPQDLYRLYFLTAAPGPRTRR